MSAVSRAPKRSNTARSVSFMTNTASEAREKRITPITVSSVARVDISGASGHCHYCFVLQVPEARRP